jgi:hypothetical protein
MHVGKMIFVLVDRAPCSVFLRVHLLTRRIVATIRRAVLLLNANLAVGSVKI